MKIKDIHLYGFKSFYGETKFLLNPGITAFVGPNGSGKSNIFDALRWVFGEQSMKALRCEKNEDLIHISPESINDTNFTEIGVIIENEDFFPQFGSEFEIKRRFYRTGESEFFLNRVKCRLQDIQALFLNSGTLTYSFLELAEIEKIIQGDTKEMFDDVSGILRYQERREQTARRLEQTEQDLLRLEDVIGEMERGVRSLRRQARQAQVYQELREEYKIVSLVIIKSEYNKVLTGAQDFQNKVNQKELEKQSILQQFNKLEDERKQLKEALTQAETAKKENIAQINALNQQIDELQTNFNQEEEKAKGLIIASERLDVSAQEKIELLATNRKKLTEYEEMAQEIVSELSKINTKADEVRRNLETISTDYFTVQKNSKTKEQEIMKLREKIETYKNEITKLESAMMNKESIISRITKESELDEKDLEINCTTKKELEKELNLIIEEQEKTTTRLTEAQKRLKNEESKIFVLEDDLQKRQSASNNLKVSIDTLTHRLGQPDGIKEIKQKLGQKITGLFRDSIEVAAGYEVIVDVCLGDILNFFLLAQIEPTDLQSLPEGKMGFINTQSFLLKPKDERPSGLKELKNLGQFSKCKSGKEFLKRYLERYYVVDDFDNAQHLSEQFLDYGFVTPDGTLFEYGTIIVQKGDVGYFKINQTLHENRKKLETLQNEVIFTFDEKKRLAGEIEKIKESIEEERTKLFTLNIKKSEISLHKNEITQQIEKTKDEIGHLEGERNTLVNEIESIKNQVKEIISKKETTGNEIARAEKEKEGLSSNVEQLKKESDEKNLTLNEIILQSTILKERQTSIEKAVESLKRDIQVTEMEIATIQKNDTAKKLTELQKSIASIKGELAIKKQARAELEAKIPDKLLEEITQKQETIYDELTKKQKHLEEIQDEIIKLNYELFQLNYKKEELLKRTTEEFNIDLITHAPEQISDVEVKQREIKERLAKLGEINPLSLQTYEQEKKRLDEFLAQRNDIIAAKQSLLKSIEELDQRARDRFIDTFSQVKEKFNLVFANFFEGGEADLVLTDPQNPLISKIEIVIRMKEKRVKTINQLSGGERTLLAVSLLLAFYLVKPAPFCILDEIDAPLDDANVVRFNKFLRDLSQRTQVVIITHNRATMEYADYLYGLTMEKLGQSKIVSVRLADLEKIDTSTG